MQKHLEMVRKLGKHFIEEITVIIMQKTKQTDFNNFCMNLTRTKSVVILYLRLFIKNFYKSNELRTEV